MDLPWEIIIELTGECNLNCSFCYNKNVKHQSILSFNDIRKLLSDISSWGVKAVRFTGGEPFLREDFGSILEAAKQEGLFVIVNTNGTLLRENLNLIQHVDLFLLTMHSSSHLKQLPKTLDVLGEKEFMLATIAVEDNINNLTEFYDFVRWIKENYNNFSEWFLLRPIQVQNEELDNNNLHLLRDKLLQNNKKYNMDIKIANSVPLCAVEGLSQVCKGGYFDAGHTRLFINAEGDAFPDYFQQAKLGNIHNKSLKEIWGSLELKSQRKYKNLPPHCKECYLLEKCKGGLKGDNNLMNPDNIPPLLSINLSPKKENMIDALNNLNQQRCRKSAFEVIVPTRFKGNKGLESYESLRIVYAENYKDALKKARGKLWLNLYESNLHKNFVIQLIRKKLLHNQNELV